METYLTQITNYLLMQSWQIAVLVVVIAAANLVLKNRSAHVRYLLWLIVLAKCLVPPLLTAPLAVLPRARLPEPIAELPFREPAIDFEIDNAPVAEAPLSLPSSVIAAPQPIIADTMPRLTARQWLGFGWIAGVTVFVLVAVTKALRTEFWLRRQRKPLPVKLKSEIEDLFSCFRIRTLPQVWLVEGIGQPFVWGVLCGNIYLPGNFVKVNSSENRRGVLGHELSHVMRFDTVVNLLGVISQAIFWFHPLVWWANKRIRAEREKCCDEMAIACLGAKAKDYSTAIVNMLITEHKSTRPVPSLAVAGPVKNIEERIKTMNKRGKKFYKRPSLMAATAVLLLALLSVPTTFVLTARAQRPEPVAAESMEAGGGTSIVVVSDQNSDAGDIPEANLQIPDELKPCAERLRTIYYALKRYEKDKGGMPDWLSDLVPDYLSAEILIWPEDGPKSTPLAAEPHLPCSFGYQYSGLAQVPGGGKSYRQFKDQERLIWGDVVPLVRYYVDQNCLNLSFDGRIYFSGTPWEKEIPTLSGKVLTDLETTSIPVLPEQVIAPTESRPTLVAVPGTIPKANLQIPDELKPCAQRLRTIYYALKLYERDKGGMPDWLSGLVPDYLSAEMLIWPEDGPKSSPLAAEPHLPCSFGYQYSSVAQVSRGGTSYRQFKNQERLIWGDVVPLVRYYVGQKCLNLSFDGRIYFSGTPWEKEIPTLSGQILTNLETTSVPASPRQVLSSAEPLPWAPEQATGEPDTKGAGDFPNAWAPLQADAGPEWLKVEFENAVNIGALRLRESFNPGAISKISAILEDGREQVLWEGEDPTVAAYADADLTLVVGPAEGPSMYAKAYSKTNFLMGIELEQDVVSRSIKIYLDTKRKRGWNEIDAVQLFSRDGSSQWACGATASSTHATGLTRSAPPAGAVSRPSAVTTRPGGDKSKVLAFDDFDGKLGLKWEILHPDKSHYSLSKRPGALTITTQDGHFKEVKADYENVFVIDTPASPDQDFQVTTCLLAFQPLEPYHQAGLICWDDQDNYLEWVYQKMDKRGLNFNAGLEAYGPTKYTYIPTEAAPEKLWLRVTKRGNSYECSSSTDGQSFTVHTVEDWGDGSPKQIGLFAINGSLTRPPEVDASFDFFEVSSIPSGQAAGLAPELAAFTVAGDAKQVFEGEYLHRSRGHDYLRTKLSTCVCVDGAILYSLKMGDASYSFVIDEDGRPEQYKYDSYDFQFSKGKVAWEQQDSQGRKQFMRALSKGALPDFNSRPDPYLVQHVLVRAYDFERCGKQTFTVFDIDNHGKSLNEYQITLEIVDENGVTLPNGRFKAKHFVQVQQTPSNTWYKKGPGSKTEYWVDDDGVILRIYRHREPYEVILTDYEQQPLAESGPPGFTIPQANLQIPDYSDRLLLEDKKLKPATGGASNYQDDLEALIQEMDRTYPFFELKGIRGDWETTKKRLLQKVGSCKSDEQFLGIVAEAVLCLRDSHMWFRDAKASLPQRPSRYYPGISFLPATNGRVVIMYGGEGLDADLKTGTVVTKIDGMDARHYLEDRAKAAWSEGGKSGPQRARLFEYRIPLRGEKKGEKHTITILLDGEEKVIELTSDIEARGWPHIYNLPKNMTQVGRSCWYTKLPSGVGYVYLRRVDSSTGPGLKQAFSTYADTRGWIIDLRGNGGGGYDQALYDALRALPEPLVGLIDAGCMSAGETLARDLVQLANAQLFGSKTAGASSAKRIWTFPSGIASLSVPTRSRGGIDGMPIEFLGIKPHVEVEAAPEELQRGCNSGILRAEEYLTEITFAETRVTVLRRSD